MDRRLTPSNGRVAHVSLRGKVQAELFSEGEVKRVAVTIAPLFDAPEPKGKRQREMVLHERFCVLDQTDGWSFGFAERDGFVGYIRTDDIGTDAGPMTHVVRARQSYLAPTPVLKNSHAMRPVSFGTELAVTAHHEAGRWAEVAALGTTGPLYVPAAHLRAIAEPETDPAAIAERFIGTPYHWGGNSGFGIDCSGLVQAAYLACGVTCPGDSDLQRERFGRLLSDDDTLARGDLVFWAGHVAMMLDGERIIHANAHHMAVTIEPLAAAIDRIETRGDGPVLAHKRIGP